MTLVDPNLRLLQVVARRLGPLRERVVFLGGAAMGLLVTDPGVGALRPTLDVDLAIEVASLVAYQTDLRQTLVGLGFEEDNEEGAPLCRWVVEGVKVDVMPTDARVLGFANRWYLAALLGAGSVELPGGPSIRLVSAPHFLATKLDAFQGRGKGDFAGSHDLEDVVTLVDGRPALGDEVVASEEDVRTFVADQIAGLLREPTFEDALPGHLRGDAASQARLPLVRSRLARLAAVR